ncbi:MAG: hypothetical protein LBB55_02705 [Zoogloeaceae bacterium]|jgi:HemY protein|nr:hypothetical protein [Zoogloeaceae bacterium]
MRALLWLVFLVALAVAASLSVHNEGFVLFILYPWRVEISLNLFLLLLLASFVLFYGFWRGLQAAFSLPARARAWREAREQKEALATIEEAIRLLFSGRYGHSLRAAERVWQAGQLTGTAALIAARAAQRMREEEKAALWLERARAAGAQAEIAADMIGAEMALEMGSHQQALAHLQDLHKRHGRHIAALRLELRCRQGLGDIPAVLKLVRQLEKRGGMNAAVAREIRRKAHQEALRQREGDMAQLLEYFHALPERERTPPLALSAARGLARAGETDAAAAILETAVETAVESAAAANGPSDPSAEWLPELITLYGQLAAPTGKALTARIARAENWLRERPHDATLLLALGRMCEKQKLWGKARGYLEASLSIADNRAAHLSLARLLDALEEPEAANRHYRLAARIDD